MSHVLKAKKKEPQFPQFVTSPVSPKRRISCLNLGRAHSAQLPGAEHQLVQVQEAAQAREPKL